MADCYADLQQQITPDIAADFESTGKILRQLLQAEAIERNIRFIRYQTQAARFPVQRHLQGFDFSQSKIDQQLIHQLATQEFTAAAQNLAIAIGTSGIQHHDKKVRFGSRH